MQNVIIIGSTGFLGSAVTRELLSAGYHVFATQNRHPVNPGPGITVIEGGIRALTAETIDRIRPAAVFHCARPVLPRLRKPGRLIAAWMAKQNNRFLVSQVAASECSPLLIFASGSLVYGNSSLPHAEIASLNPVSYARQYHYGEKPLVQAVHDNNRKVIVLRFPWILGNGSWFSWFYLKPARERRMVPLFGEGTNNMTLISLADAARIMVHLGATGKESGVYNIYSPHTLTQRSLAETIAVRYGAKVTGYRALFPGGVEKAVKEAFTSNILLTTNHPGLLKDYPFQGFDRMLDEIDA